jgi:hypothetical protein
LRKPHAASGQPQANLRHQTIRQGAQREDKTLSEWASSHGIAQDPGETTASFLKRAGVAYAQARVKT